MGFFTFLSGKKLGNKSTKVKKDVVDLLKKGGSSVTFDASVTSTSNTPTARPEEPTITANEKLVEDYMAAKNRHASVDEMLSFYSSPKAKIRFDDYGSMTALQLITEIRNLYLGFEDLNFGFESIKEVSPGEVLVEELCVTGTHTADLKFANYPAVPRTNKYVICDPERLWFYVKDGKLTGMDDTALGNITGPPGMYQAVGGKLSP